MQRPDEGILCCNFFVASEECKAAMYEKKKAFVSVSHSLIWEMGKRATGSGCKSVKENFIEI